MAFVLPDWVWETTTTVGTGAYSLAGAVTNYRAFSSQLSNGDTCYYSCWDGTNYEEGVGTYATAGNTLARTTIYRSTNANAAVNWTAGTRQIMVSALGVTMQSMMTPGSTGFPNRSADNTWSYYNTTGSGTTVALGTSPTFTTSWGMNSDVSLKYEAANNVGWHTTTSDAHTTGNGLVQNIYTYYTDASNYEGWKLNASIGSGDFQITHIRAGTYATNTRALRLGATTNVIIAPDAGTILQTGLAAGTASQAPLSFAAGTNLTTAAAGAEEYDGTVFYKTNNTSNRGLSPAVQYAIYNGTTYTLNSVTTAQKLFNTSTNGTITLPTGIFEFECLIALTGLSSTSGNVSFLMVAGASSPATFTELWLGSGVRANGTGAISISSINGGWRADNTANGIAISSATTSVASVAKGVLRVTVAGTIQPQIQLSQAAAAVVSAGTYIKITQIGNTSTQTIGNWS